MNPTAQRQSDLLEQQVATTRRRLRRNAVAAGFALVVAVAAGWLTLGATADMLVAMSVPLRVAAWAVLWLIIAGGLAAAVLWPAVRTRRLQDVAFRIERSFGGMHNRLVSVLDLREGRTKLTDRSGPFADRLVEQTAQRMAGYRLEQVADPRPVGRVILAACVVLAAAMALGLGLGDRMGTAVRRIVMPTRPIPPVTSVRLEAHPGDTSVLQGQPLRLWATVAGGEVDGLTLRLHPADGQWLNYPMEREPDGRFAFTLSAVNASYDYQVAGGGTWTLPNRITMVRRPVVEHLAVTVHLPAYMNLPEPRPVDEHAGQISAPVGSAVEIEATVAGDVAEGVIHLFQADTRKAKQTERRETLWFDDEVPPDAELTGTWRWVTDRVYGGTRAHTFGWDRKPYGFRTRLNRLSVAPEESLFVFAWLDPDDPPGRLILTVSAGEKTADLAWDSPRAPLADEEKKTLRHVGPLPAPGAWHRLEVPVATILGAKPAGPTELDGLAFRVDKGAVTFDRAGAVRQVTRAMEQTELERLVDLSMRRDEKTGRWVGRIPVETDRHFTVEFRSPLGHPSAAMKAVPLVAIADQPPTLLVERPGKSLTVPEPQPVPLMVRAFDDYGVADVWIQTGAAANAFGDPKALARYDKPETNRMVVGALDTRQLGLEPGQSVYYRVLVRDRKGQQVASEPFRLGLGEAQAERAETVTRDREAMGGLLDGIGRMVDVLGLLGDGAREVLSSVPQGVRIETGASGAVELLNRDGTPLTAGQIRGLLDRWKERISDEQLGRLAELRKQALDDRQRLFDLAGDFNRVAEGAERSVYQLPIEAEALRAMAERARQLAELMPQTPLGDGLDADVLARLARLQELSGEGQKELADLQGEFERLMAARQTLAESPFEAQQQYADLMTQLRAQQAMHQMAGLNDYFQSQQELLGAMREQMAALRGQTESADAKALAALSAKQQELDPEALELMRRAQQLLQDRLEKMQQDRDLLPPAPWVPPGRREQAMPLEADTPEEDPRPEGAGKPDLEAMRRRLDAMAAEQPDDWWDQPVDVPPTPVTLEENDRFAGRRRPTDPAAPWMTEGFETPRRMLMQHQDQFYQALTANSSRMSAVQGQLGQVMSQLEQAMMPMQGQWQVSGPLSPDAMQQLQQTLGSRAMQQMMGMLSQAAMQMAQARSGMPGASAQAAGTDSQTASRIARPGMVLNVDLGGVDVPPGQGAALYRPPPWMRQPLVEGMQERGPEAYQPLIDAYYRQLSTEVESPSGGAEKAPPVPAPQPPAPPAPAPKAEPPKTPPAPPAPAPKAEPPKTPPAPPAPAAPAGKKEAKPGS